jgi:hypothetical protein
MIPIILLILYALLVLLAWRIVYICDDRPEIDDYYEEDLAP